ncbi:unannotated protein [freshwater metagenome]|uniref:Unannotated protein n=1 Tax=freshwater metagenome TaxID=449393 RepID=A0A6J6YTL8_9ZZZZ|nr:hypothetical protein [Actinomycetota bacterium]MSX70450.1 hypothetical protein [Actinomycetota bacterium]
MAIRYESGSTYFPGYETNESKIEYISAEEVARRSLVNRREITLLDDESVMKVAALLAERTRKPDFWIRSAITTLDRFSREVCNSDLASALESAKKDSLLAELMIEKFLSLHSDLTNVQLASLLFGPKLWFSLNGVDIPWSVHSSSEQQVHIANSKARDFNPAVRLLMLSLVGTGLTYEEVATIKVKDAGSIDKSGKLVPNHLSSPLAIEFTTPEGVFITFLGEEARAVLVEQLTERGAKADDLLFADKDQLEKFKERADARGKAIIETVNDVNVTLCKTVGDFFLQWGVPGANFYKENGLPQPDYYHEMEIPKDK